MDSPSPPSRPADAGEAGDVFGVLEEGRRRFLELVAHLRPELHRYCTRMTGSVTDGEDVVQETLARAFYELSEWKALPPLRPWLFRIAHNRAIDHWRHEMYRVSEPLSEAFDVASPADDEPDSILARRQAVSAAVASFMALAPAQRACVILKDVLDHSLDEIADELSLSVPAVKAALHRGRTALQRSTNAVPQPAPARAVSPALQRYANLFNAHDWDGVRALLADDVALDLVSQRKAAGRRDVGAYFSNYARLGGWRLSPAWLDAREVLAVLSGPEPARPRYVIELTWRDGQVAAIQDFRYVTYIAQDDSVELCAPMDPGQHEDRA